MNRRILREPPRFARCRSLIALTAILLASLLPAACKDRGADGQAQPAPASAAPRPNILFLLIDTLRGDKLGCAGYGRNLSPTMDAIAAEGVMFQQAVAQSPWTQPSVVSLFTAMYPGAILPVDEYRKSFDAVRRGATPVRVLDEHYATIASALQWHGYQTAAITANPYVTRVFGLARGFEHFDETLATQDAAAGLLSDAACRWLQQRDSSRPFFLYLHYMDVHGPYNAGPEFLDPLLEMVDAMPQREQLTDNQLHQLDPRYLATMPPVYTDPARHERLWRTREYWEARYEAGVAEMDHHLAALRGRLAEMGLWDDLVVIVTADHGEGLGEHVLFEHGFSTHHTELHVPLIIRWPGAIAAGGRVAETVRLMDVAPTLLDLLDVAPMKDVQAVSLVPYIRGDPPPEPLTGLSEGLKIARRQVALYRGEWKLALPIEPPVQLLYHFTEDPLERRNLAGQDPDMLGMLLQMEAEQRAENDRLATAAQRQSIELSPEQLRRLRSLGYVGDEEPDEAEGEEDR
jgi:arylsulfatase A-like enzyme